MVLSGMVLHIALLVVLAHLALSVGAPLGTVTRSSAPQTQWQKALFKNVSERAAQLSDAAVPTLLAKLDSAEFRAELTKCCPSVSGLSAAQLLERLQEEIQVVEVVSGFPAVMDAKHILPDFPIMTVADGLRGSFFQNSWQGVLLDAKDPDLVFHKIDDTNASASCRNGVPSMSSFGVSGCGSPPLTNTTFPAGQCMRNVEAGVIYELTCNSSVVTQAIWIHDQQARSESGVQGSFTTVPCPTDKPVRLMYYMADDRCHRYVFNNASSVWRMEDSAEMESYGLRPFANAGAPKSLQEASERGPYCVVNQPLYDAGSFLYGQVSAVFSSKAMLDTALLSAIDTGLYQSSCKDHQPLVSRSGNCSAYKPLRELGTMRHFNHLFLISDNFWTGASVLAQRFARLEGEWGSRPIAGWDLLNYWEALPAATLQFPNDIRFLIGSFPSLFGSATGASLQQWAKQRGWVLVWSLGPNVGKRDLGSFLFRLMQTNQTFALNQRLLDPDVALNTSAAGNLSLNGSVLEQFRHSWAEMEALRNRSSGNVSNSTWAKLWYDLMHALPPKLHMRPLRAGACLRSQEAPECIGLNGDGCCVCYSQANVAAPQSSGELLVV